MGLFDFWRSREAATPSGDAAMHTPPRAAGTLGVELDALCARYQARYSRQRREDGTVQLSLHFPSGDTLTGHGGTTAAALADLRRKVESLGPSLGVSR